MQAFAYQHRIPTPAAVGALYHQELPGITVTQELPGVTVTQELQELR